jgi:DNA-binding response OmpR family regulator
MKKRILVVEDEQLLREAYCEILSAEGYDVDSAENGVQGHQKLLSFQPDLVLLDILMPHGDGLEFMKRADIKDKHPGVKVLIFSNLSSVNKVNDILEMGAYKHVLKSSLAPNDLAKLIRDTLKDDA